MNARFDTEKEVLARYAEASERVEKKLCCAVSYDVRLLDVLPREIVDKDYGCGDPTGYVREGDVVLDLGSGAGKICYIASQIVGPGGQVIGVDFNPPMLALARRHRDEIARRVGWDNVSFKYGKIQDLKTDYDAVEEWLAAHPVTDVASLGELERFLATMRSERPLIADGSVDLVVSNCVLNLVPTEDKAPLFGEMYRVLRRGGRIAVSDIVCSEPVPQSLRDDPDLWTGCISGAFAEHDFLRAFESAGFRRAEIAARDEKPWRVIDGHEFRSVTVTAAKGEASPRAGGSCGAC